MSMMLLLIDWQKFEVDKLPGGQLALSSRIRGFRDDAKALGVETLHVMSGAYPDIGPFHEVEKRLAAKFNNFCLSRSPAGFAIPVDPHDMVAMKHSYSANRPHIIDYLHGKGIKTVVLAGMTEGPIKEAECCVTASGIDFAKNGFRVLVGAEVTNIAIGSNSGHGRTRQQRVHDNLDVGMETMPITEILALAKDRHIVGREEPSHRPPDSRIISLSASGARMPVNGKQ